MRRMSLPEYTDVRETRGHATEIKFLIDPERAKRIRDWARARLAPDPNGTGAAGDEYAITSLYFDTGDFDVFNRRGSFGRAKYRIRRYGASDAVFLERKMRTRSLLTKRRTSVALDDLDCLDDLEPGQDWAGRWFHRRLTARRMRPTCQVSYQRTARVGTTDLGPIRLTIDDEIRVIPRDEPAFGPREGMPALDRQLILELKFAVAMPAVFKQLIEEFTLDPQRLSKYRLGVSALTDRGARLFPIGQAAPVPAWA
jgi:hypothetical protein